MQIVNRAQDYTSDNSTLNPPIVEGQANPMRRDTVQVPEGSSVALRIVADNPGAWILHCLYPPLSFSIQELTVMLYRPHRMAPRGRSGGDFHRSATSDAAACPDNAKSALHSCTAMPRAKSASLRQCCRSRIHNGSIRLADGAIPAKQWLAHKGHTRDDRMRAHCRYWHAHRRVVRDRWHLER
jgi:Multicopper oxidase